MLLQSENAAIVIATYLQNSNTRKNPANLQLTSTSFPNISKWSVYRTLNFKEAEIVHKAHLSYVGGGNKLLFN